MNEVPTPGGESPSGAQPISSRRGRALVLSGAAALLMIVIAGCGSGSSDTSGSSGSGSDGGACAPHTVEFGETIYHEFGTLRGEHGRKVGTGSELTSCNDALEGPSGDATLTTPSPGATAGVTLYAIGTLDPAQAVAIETDADGVVMLVPADGTPDKSLARYLSK